MTQQTRTWEIVDHICRICGGRILRCVTGAGMTPGGNPLWRCADCGNINSGISVDCVCWCGYTMRNQEEPAYLCMPLARGREEKELAWLLGSCGFDVNNQNRRGGEIGIVPRMRYREWETQKREGLQPSTLAEARLAWRGIKPGEECSMCKGAGVRVGSNGKGERTPLICGVCWGSGDEKKPWPAPRPGKKK